jgi:hypothetical protein
MNPTRGKHVKHFLDFPVVVQFEVHRSGVLNLTVGNSLHAQRPQTNVLRSPITSFAGQEASSKGNRTSRGTDTCRPNPCSRLSQEGGPGQEAREAATQARGLQPSHYPDRETSDRKITVTYWMNGKAETPQGWTAARCSKERARKRRYGVEIQSVWHSAATNRNVWVRATRSDFL